MGLQVHVLSQKRAVKTDEGRSRHGMERTQTTRRKEMLTAKEVAAQLHVPLSWVYRHKRELGGIQPSCRCSVRFFDNCIETMRERAYAISDEKREMARQKDDRRDRENPRIPNKSRGKEVGSRTVHRVLDTTDYADPYGLLA